MAKRTKKAQEKGPFETGLFLGLLGQRSIAGGTALHGGHVLVAIRWMAVALAV